MSCIIIKMNTENYDLYKPLRNHLRKLSVEESLYVVWAYSQHLTHRSDIPEDIEVAGFFQNAKLLHDKKTFLWEFDLLAKEIIINGKIVNRGEESLKAWSYLSRTLNKLKELLNKLSGRYTSSDNIEQELMRIAHQQFPWQESVDSSYFTRYYKIFSDEVISQIIEEKLGFSTHGLYGIGGALWAHYLDSPAIKFPIKIELKGVETSSLERFLDIFSEDIIAIKDKLSHENSIDEKYAFGFSALTSKPLIRMQYQTQNCLVCPLPTRLFRRITSGVYFDVCREKGFDQAFGVSFERYVGEVCNKANKYSAYVVKEETYKVGKDIKKTSDWIIENKSNILFIECKTKRLKQLAKEEVLDTEPYHQELQKMSDFIVQIYKTIHDYRQGNYPSDLMYDEGKSIYPIVLTLEDWYVFGYSPFDQLDSSIKQKLTSKSLPVSYLTEMPYSIMCISEFESFVQLSQTVDIGEIMSKKLSDPEKKKWAMNIYMNSVFKSEMDSTDFLFQDDFEAMFDIYK